MENGATWDKTLSIDALVTAGVIAGGSKGAMKLFQGVLGFGHDAVKAQIAANKKIAVAKKGNQPQQPR